jgi:phosphatidate cytidylyltransferase
MGENDVKNKEAAKGQHLVRTRIIMGATMTAAVVALWAIDYVLGTMYLYYLLVAFLVGWGAWEFFNIAEARGCRPHKYLGVFCAVMLALSSREIVQKIFGLPNAEMGTPAAGIAQLGVMAAVSILVVGVFFQQILKRGANDAFADISATVFGVMYIGFLGSFFIKIRHLYHPSNPLVSNCELANILFVVLVLGGTKGADIAAFFIGRKWGRHKLIPQISPKKSLEGAVAGLAFGAVFGLIWAAAFGDVLRFKAYFGIIFGFTLAFAGLAGDLAESLIKRKASVKDSGHWIPTYGGLLDVIDAPLFGAPAAYYLWLVINQMSGGFMRPLVQ